LRPPPAGIPPPSRSHTSVAMAACIHTIDPIIIIIMIQKFITRTFLDTKSIQGASCIHSLLYHAPYSFTHAYKTQSCVQHTFTYTTHFYGHNRFNNQWALILELSAPAPSIRLNTRNMVLTHWRHLAEAIPLCSH
jgi:hypothetical protein